MSTTFLAFIDALANEQGLTDAEVENRLIYKFSAATIGNASLTTTDPQIAKLTTSAASGRFTGMHIYLATAAEIRTVTTNSVTSGGTATLSFAGANATNQAGATNAYLLKVPWADIKDAANDALEFRFTDCLIPLAHGPDDATMQDAGTTSWTGTATIAKQTTASEVFTGKQSLSITDGGSGGQYAQSTLVNMGQSKTATIHVILKADTGTATIQILDNSSNVQDSVAITQEDWTYVTKQVAFDSTDEGVRIRIVATTASGQVDVAAAWVVKQGSSLFRVPSWVSNRFNLKGITAVTFSESLNEANAYLADSWDEAGVDAQYYRYKYRGADANPAMIQLTNWARWDTPLFLELSCPWSAPYGKAATFSADSDSTDCDLHILLPQTKYFLGQRFGKSFPEAEHRGLNELKERVMPRRTESVKPQVWQGPTARRV